MQAPKASASYSPDLPLVAAPSQPASATASARRQLQDPESGNELDSNSLDGTPSGSRSATDEPDPTLLPSIDYPRYFANFEGRPLDQHLKLSLRLDKKHFMVSCSCVLASKYPRWNSIRFFLILANQIVDFCLFRRPIRSSLSDAPPLRLKC